MLGSLTLLYNMITLQNETESPPSPYLSAGIIPQVFPFLADGWEKKCFEL